MESPSAPTVGSLPRIRSRLSRAWTYLGLRAALRPLASILVVGLAIRLILLPLTAHPFDFFEWWLAGRRFYAGQGIYATSVLTFDYPPVWGGFIIVTSGIYRVLAAVLHVAPLPEPTAQMILGTSNYLGAPIIADWVFVTLVKLPIVLFDVLLTALLYRIVALRLGRPAEARLAAGLFFLNPLTILMSSIWGQFDVIAAYLTLLGLLLFLDQNPIAGAAVLGLATATKYFPVLLILTLGTLYFRSSSRTTYLRAFAVFAGIILVISAPFLVLNSTGFLSGVGSPATARSQSMDTFWLLFSYFPSVVLPSYVTESTVIAALAVAAVLGLVLRHWSSGHPPPTLWVDACVVSLLGFFLVYRTINDQYFVWLLPFLVMDVIRGTVRPGAFGLLTSLVTVHAYLSIAGSSFFLPSLTLSRSFALIAFVMPHNMTLINSLAVAVWATVVYLFATRLRKLHAQLVRGRASPSTTPVAPPHRWGTGEG